MLSSFAADGVRYLELRTTPRASPAHDIDKQTYVQTILDVIQEFEEEQKREEKDDSRRMATYLLLSIDRAAPVADAEDTLAVAVAVALRDHRLLGLDLCGNPNAGTAAAFVPLLTRARADHGLRLTVHFGETATAGTDAELEALLACGPSRLGHVIYVGDRVAAEVARRRLGLELCLSCNVHAGMVEGGFEKHHFGTWWLQGAEVRCPILLSVGFLFFSHSGCGWSVGANGHRALLDGRRRLFREPAVERIPARGTSLWHGPAGSRGVGAERDPGHLWTRARKGAARAVARGV